MATLGFHVAVVFESNSGLPEDRCVNTFNWTTDNTDDTTQAATIAAILQDFYNLASGDSPISSYLSPELSRTQNVNVNVYKLTSLDPTVPLGSPFYNGQFTLGGSGGATPLPSEVAAVLSIHGDLVDVPEEGPGNTRPRAQRRGRIYLGPLHTDDMDVSPTGYHALLTDQMVGDVTLSASDLRAAGVLLGPQWSVWSRANQALYPITGGFMDNAFDTQRRRGEAASARTSWT